MTISVTKLRKTLRYHKAANWTRRGAMANPGIRFTASLGDMRLAAWLQDGKLKRKQWYVTEET